MAILHMSQSYEIYYYSSFLTINNVHFNIYIYLHEYKMLELNGIKGLSPSFVPLLNRKFMSAFIFVFFVKF